MRLTLTSLGGGTLEITDVKSEVKNGFFFLQFHKCKLNKQKQAKGNAARLEAGSF